MLGPLRTLISVAFLVMFLWAAFTVRLGPMTFADHVDRIGQTPEAQDLLDGARSRVRPTLEEVKQRVLGEYVEAPTHLSQPPPPASRARSFAAEPDEDPRAATLATRSPEPTRTRAASTRDERRQPDAGTRDERRQPGTAGTRDERRQPGTAGTRDGARRAAGQASTAEAAKLPGRRPRP